MTTTVVGNGTAGYTGGTASASLASHPFGVAFGANGDAYWADQQAFCIRKMSATTGIVTAAVGMCGTNGTTDGTLSSATLGLVIGVALAPNDDIFVTEGGTAYTIRQYSAASGYTTTIVGTSGVVGTALTTPDGPAASTLMKSPSAIAMDPSGTVIYFSEAGTACYVRKLDLTTMYVTTVAGMESICGRSYAGGGALNTSFGSGGPQGLALYKNDLYISGEC